MIYIIALLAILSTFLGGLFALRFKDKLHLILGFSAGAVIGVAIFDLIPEAFEIAGGNIDAIYISLMIAIGFCLYMIADRFFGGHSHKEEDDNHDGCENHCRRGNLGAGSLSLHSLIDGLAVGLAFKVSPIVGGVVAIAVLAHSFSDGINTVGVVIRSGGNIRNSFKWLIVDALAPAIGIILATVSNIDEKALGPIISIFAGSFLYLGASDLLPESHHKHPAIWTTVASLIGVFLIFIIVKFAH